MWAERMRRQWQHTSYLAATLIEINRGKSGKKTRPDDLNPMESGNRVSMTSVSLDSPEGFAALAQVASWQPRR